MTTLTLTSDIDAAELRARVEGDVVFPCDPGWDEARLAWNLAADQRPAAVVYPESAEDVAAIVTYARLRGYRVAPQGTGHNAAALGRLDSETILLKTERMRGVEIDPSRARARVDAGVIWQEVVDAAAEHGLAALHGSAHDVGVVGYSLGGGIGWYARRYGMSANSVLAVELVTADGSIVRADANHEPELFWAVRGGGGSFGVVTAVEIALLPITEVYAGVLFWPVERAPEVLKAYAAWAETVPDEVTSAGRIMQFPPFPGIPEPLRGNTFALVEVAALLDEVEGAALVAPLRELGPAMDTMTLMPAQALTSLHMDPPSPVPGAGDGTTISELTDETVDALVAVAGAGSGSPLLSVELRQLGGALARRAPGNGAAASVDGAYAVFAVGMAPTPEAEAETRHHVERVLGALEPWKAERTYFNFTERSVDSGELHAAETLARLRAVKAAVDPDELFRVVHPIAPAE